MYILIAYKYIHKDQNLAYTVPIMYCIVYYIVSIGYNSIIVFIINTSLGISLI